MIRRILIVCGFVFALGSLDGMFSRMEEESVREAQYRAERKRAELHAAILSHCANGGDWKIADDTIRCRRLR